MQNYNDILNILIDKWYCYISCLNKFDHIIINSAEPTHSKCHIKYVGAIDIILIMETIILHCNINCILCERIF